jgi:hypothetical protein
MDRTWWTLRGLVTGAARAGSVSGVNEIHLIGAIVALTGALASLALIRERDVITTNEFAVAAAA